MSDNHVVGTLLGGAEGDGILVHRGATGNTISKNTVVGSADDGISVIRGATSPADSKFNTIKDNVSVLNDGVDLKHDAGSSPNTWDKNTCQTKSQPAGGDIAGPPVNSC